MLHFTTKNTWTDAKPLPPYSPQPLSRCSPSRFVCRTHVNEVLIVACPLWVTFGFVSLICVACFPGAPCVSPPPPFLAQSVAACTFCIIFEHFRAKRCQFVGPPQKKRGAPHDNCLKWRRFSFHTFQFNLGKSRHTAAAASIKKCAGKSTTKMIYSRWI